MTLLGKPEWCVHAVCVHNMQYAPTVCTFMRLKMFVMLCMQPGAW